MEFELASLFIIRLLLEDSSPMPSLFEAVLLAMVQPELEIR